MVFLSFSYVVLRQQECSSGQIGNEIFIHVSIKMIIYIIIIFHVSEDGSFIWN